MLAQVLYVLPTVLELSASLSDSITYSYDIFKQLKRVIGVFPNSKKFLQQTEKNLIKLVVLM